jgi:hypothetical protein
MSFLRRSSANRQEIQRRLGDDLCFAFRHFRSRMFIRMLSMQLKPPKRLQGTEKFLGDA